MPRPRRHYLDDLADDLFDWMQAEIEALTDAFQAGGRSPFAAPVSEAQKIQFYDRALFMKSGEPNQTGRAATLARIGVDGYVQVMDAVMKYRQTGHMDEEAGEAPSLPEQAEGEGA